MGLISKEVEVVLNSKNIKHYEDLGYKIPRYIDKRNVLRVKSGSKIKIKVKDLLRNSTMKVEVKCDCCNKEIIMTYQSYNDYKHGDKYYCNKCSKKLFYSGENSPNYKKSKTDEDRLCDRKYPEYIDFIKKVLARDNYTCKCCGNHTNNAEVHHLDGYDWCVERRTDEQNGITLCKTCHKNFHSIYGRGGNTKQQFEKWIGKAIGELEKYNGILPTARKIYCIEEDKIYDSAGQLAKEWGVKSRRHVYDVCNHKKAKKGYCKSLKGKHLLWLDEYEKCTEEDIQEYLQWCKPMNDNNKNNIKQQESA